MPRNSLLTTDRGVPHISLVFREMWETQIPLGSPWRGKDCRLGTRSLPHLAKNERDMGHPSVRGQAKSQSRLLNPVLTLAP